MPEPVSSIRNLGPASNKSFAKVGVTTAEQLRALGPDKAYKMLLDNGSLPHFIGYYALVMGLQGRPWNDCQGEEKEALRVRFDGLKSKTAVKSPIEKELDRLGVILPR